MSQPPHDPYRGDPYPGERYGDDPYGRPSGHGQDPYGGWQEPGYPPAPPAGDPPHGQYGPPRSGPRASGAPRPEAAPSRPLAAPPRPDTGGGLGLRMPSPGLLLTLIGLAVQLISATLLPIARTSGATSGSLSLPSLWSDVLDQGARGFGEWYVLVFSYPLFALGALMALAAVLESVAMKVVWGGLTVLALIALVLKYGLGPFTGLFDSATGGKEFSPLELVLAGVGLVLLVGMVFVLRMAVSMFRRVAGLILLALSGVHITAVLDLVKTTDLTELSFGAYGPALGYVLIAVGVFVGPRRIPGL